MSAAKARKPTMDLAEFHKLMTMLRNAQSHCWGFPGAPITTEDAIRTLDNAQYHLIDTYL